MLPDPLPPIDPKDHPGLEAAADWFRLTVAWIRYENTQHRLARRIGEVAGLMATIGSRFGGGQAAAVPPAPPRRRRGSPPGRRRR